MNRTQFRKLPQLALHEARQLVASTDTSTVFTGHLHHSAVSLDDAGWRYYQCPSPTPDDDYHAGEGYVGSRKQIQGVLLYEGSGDDQVVNMSV